MALVALAALAMFAPQTAAAITPGRVEFEILRNGAPTGRHVVEVARSGDAVTAQVRIEMAGRVGPFAYGYAHKCVETWRNGALEALSCTDEERGKPQQRVTARRNGKGVDVQAAAFTGLAPFEVEPSSWWRKEALQERLIIDTRTGALTPLDVRRIGEETVVAGGETVRATRYRIRGSTTADIWYDGEDRWVKMAFRVRGQAFEYRKITPVSAAPRA